MSVTELNITGMGLGRRGEERIEEELNLWETS
jgi:hypothetical protein